MNAIARLFALACVLVLLTACATNRKELRRAIEVAEARAPTALDCDRADACAVESPLLALGSRAFAASTAAQPRHYVQLLEGGQEALLARIHLIRAARTSIELQSYLFAEDDAGYFVLNELLEAARRGVEVRVLLDQLYSLEDVEMLAHLSHAHANFAIRLYNPTFGEARTEPLQFVASALCCFFRFNQRMHNKLLVVDGRVGITGGRNYQNRYFDWDPEFNFRDRDVLVAGPAVGDMQSSFDSFWNHELSVPTAGLRDVAPLLLDPAHTHEAAPAPRLTHAERITAMSAEAGDAALIAETLAADVLEVGRVEFIADIPMKGSEPDAPARRDTGEYLRTLLAAAEHEIVLQTPYLVLSRRARQMFRALQLRPRPPEVIVSTNSLASTDAFPVYALSHKYKRTYLREFGFDIYEFKPFPADAPIDLASTGADGERVAPLGARASEWRRRFRLFGSSERFSGPLPLEQAGVRVSLHAKSMVVDARLAIIGSHNFDPRSDHHNTESLLVVHDAAFATRLRGFILSDTQPGNAWAIAPRPKPPVLSGLNYSLGKLFEQLPLFDFWPWRYATSWEHRGLPDCPPLPADHARFAECYEEVGDFPEVNLEPKGIYTRIVTAFGAGLAPIL